MSHSHSNPLRRYPRALSGSCALLAAAALLVRLPQPATASEPATDQNYMGMNVWYVSDWGCFPLFADLMKSSRHWGSVAKPWDRAATVDSNGWPMSDAGAMFFSGGASGRWFLPKGTYKVKFKGFATTVKVGGAAVANKAYDSAANTTTADWVLGADRTWDTSITLEGTDRDGNFGSDNTPDGDGVTDVQVFRPGYATDGSDVLTTEAITAGSKFHLIRWMQSLDINNGANGDWTKRTKPSDATQSDKTVDWNTANAWAGSADAGEFYVVGSYFRKN